MKNIGPIGIIRIRKIRRTSPLRRHLLRTIKVMLQMENPFHRVCTFISGQKRIKMFISTMSWVSSNKKRRIFEVAMEVVRTVRDTVTGKTKTIPSQHRFEIYHILPPRSVALN